MIAKDELIYVKVDLRVSYMSLLRSKDTRSQMCQQLTCFFK